MPLIECLSYDRLMEKAEKLSRVNDGKNEIPKNVVDIIKYCYESGFGVILSRNPEVTSCENARGKRYRLGNEGIPLYDELKSLILKGVDKNGEIKFIIAHCRGHMFFNFKAIKRVFNLKNKPCQINSNELTTRFKMEYGTVNPFQIEIYYKKSVSQIFDNGLLKPISNYPGTMMTNAGDLTWGIEFDPVLLIERLSNAEIGNIAVEQDIPRNQYIRK